MRGKFFKCAVAFALAVLMGAEPVMSYAMTASDGGTVSSEGGSARSGTDAADTEDTREEMMGSVLQDLESPLQEQREQILSDLGMTEEEFETYEPEGYFESGDPSVSEASGILPVGVQDIEYTDEQTGFTCRELNGTYAEIIGYSGTAAELFIPGTLGVYTIQAIGDNAFQDNTSLTSVTMASSITSIGSYAFEGCSSLMDIYYKGTESQWEKVEIWRGNGNVSKAAIHYNSDASEQKNDISSAVISGVNLSVSVLIRLFADGQKDCN